MLTITGFVCLVLIIAAIIAVAVAKAQSKHTFICHNCGKEFQPQWTQMVFEVHAFDKHRLKCPYCKKTDFCTDQGKAY